MLVRTIRSDVTEATDRVSGVAVSRNGTVLASFGEPDRPLFYRSAIKPLQATVVRELGVALPAEHLAVTCSSHSGHPIQLATVRTILRDGGLEPLALQTPPSWPLAETARARLHDQGHRRPRRIFHNCSGKHAGFLRACVAQGWSVEDYLQPDHPLQQAILEELATATGEPVTPVGVDGCGAPTLRGTCTGLARAFSAVSVDDRYRPVADACHRFPALVSGNERGEGRLGAWWGGPVKGGAQGLIGAGRHGIGLAVKSNAGSPVAAVMGMMHLMRSLGMLPTAAIDALSHVATPAVLGGGRAVGTIVTGNDT